MNQAGQKQRSVQNVIAVPLVEFRAGWRDLAAESIAIAKLPNGAKVETGWIASIKNCFAFDVAGQSPDPEIRLKKKVFLWGRRFLQSFVARQKGTRGLQDYVKNLFSQFDCLSSDFQTNDDTLIHNPGARAS
jgi:hypothetical protein